ncbi:hypothetical protein PTKIN_Ptkin13bG0097400 [Pterospermum kingtungense]
MDVEMETSPSYFDPLDHSAREKFRRYGKRMSSSSISPRQESGVSNFNEAKLLYEGSIIHSPTNAALLLENIKQEAESFDTDYFEEMPSRTRSASKRRPSNKKHLQETPSKHRIAEVDNDVGSIRKLGSHALKACKIEEDLLADNGDTTFAFFASLLDSALQGLMPIPDLILQFEKSCRDVSESIRYESNIRHRVVEDKLMRQKAQLLLDEAATWSLLWYLYGKGNESLTFENF